ncbi:MAG: NAD(P)H-hydrate dehydratase [Bdellovibrionales bacterium]|nr:NAD(P)H-hydrate dehydratase [Bdellovibrionales bacterium]
MKDSFLKFDLKAARKLLPKRKSTDNKSSAGKTYIIGGSKGMFGAAVLAATAAARMGSGYTYVVSHGESFPTFKHPNFLTMPWTKFLKLNFNEASIAIGPGLGKSKHSLKLLKALLRAKAQHVVIDADALNICSEYKLLPLPASWIATPHEGELSRLIGWSSDKIRKNRKAAILLAEKKLHCTVILKGHKTLVASRGKYFEIQSGNAALAKAGTGDTLTGMIAALVAQGLTAQEAAPLAAFVHGNVADEWLKDQKDILSLLATDLIDALPKILAKLR